MAHAVEPSGAAKVAHPTSGVEATGGDDLDASFDRANLQRSPEVTGAERKHSQLAECRIGAPLWKKAVDDFVEVPSPPTATTTGRDSRTAAWAISIA